MNASPVRRAAALGALLLLSAFAASASELRALSENEMSDVYGRGLADPATAFGALGLQEQSGAYASAADLQPALGALSADGAKNLERQLAQAQLQVASTGLQSTIRTAQTLAAATQVLAPVSMAIPVLPFPFLLGLGAMPSMPGLPALPSLPGNGNSNGGKH